MNNNKKKNIVLIVLTKFIRLDDVIKWSAISFIGFILGISTFSIQEIILPLSVFIASAFCIFSFCFAINNYYDADSDRENPRRMHSNALASGEISKKTGMAINIFLIVISLLVSGLFKAEVFYLSIILLVWFGAYSIPPLRIKGRPGIDVLWHFFGFFFIILWGALITGSLHILTWLIAVSLGVFSCIGQLWNHYDDYTFDKESGTRTFAVQAGLKTTKKTIHFILGIHLILLLPLCILYSIHYLITLVIVVSGIVLGLLLLQPKKDGFPTKKSYEYYLATVVGGSVYVSCLFYHLFSVIGMNLIKIF
jgi:4-hydroxybenzoate polyprenyltransferase